MKISNLFLIFAVIFISTAACNKEDEVKPISGFTEETGFTHGVFVTNEGTFMNNNGSISYFDPTTESVTNNLFMLQNNIPLGDVVQSFSVVDELGFIIVNNSNKVEVVDMVTFKRTGQISVTYPRYLKKVAENKAYLTTGAMEGYVYVINTQTIDTVSKISVGLGPENILVVDNEAYIANSGGWSNDNTVSVIDINTDKLTETIAVAENPIDLAIDNQNVIWVLCKGKLVYNWESPYQILEETDSKIVKINKSTKQVESEFVVGAKSDGFTPGRLSISPDKSSIYLLEKDGVYKFESSATGQPSSPLISGSFYSFEVSDSGEIYVFSAGDFTSNGTMAIYDENGGLLKSSFKVGIGPNNAAFN